MPARSRVARIELQRYRVTHNKLSLSILGKLCETNEVPHNESETEKPKDFSKRSASCIGNTKSSVNAKLKKRKRSIRFVLKSRKPILSSTQKPAEYLDREKKIMSRRIVFFVQLLPQVRGERSASVDSHRRLNLPYLIVFMSDYSARLE